MREIVIGADGEPAFGPKVRDWNRTELVEQWRERWADHVNTRLAELDIDARIDHRSLETQDIALEPQDKIGPAASRMEGRGLQAERIEQHREIARRNGERIGTKPRVAPDAITHGQATFTNRDLAMFVHRHTDGKDQYDRAMSAVRASPDLIALGKDGRGEQRFTSREMIDTEQRLQRAADGLARGRGINVPEAPPQGVRSATGTTGLILGHQQQAALEHTTGDSHLAIVVGYAGTGKSAMLGVAREAWEAAGLTVRGAALSGIAAEGLEHGSGIASRTIASLEHGWSQGRDVFTSRDVLVIDEAGMIGTRQMERVLSHAADAGAKVVLVGDPQHLQAIEAGAAFRAIHYGQGGVEITDVRRQHEAWQQQATRHLATGRTGEAIAAYAERGRVHAAETREAARGELIKHWNRDRQANSEASRIVLTHTNDEVRLLNEAARAAMRASGDLGEDVAVEVERGDRRFAAGDRVMFLRNERSLEVKNGTLGVIERADARSMAVRTDDGRRVAFDLKDYRYLDHGYAATFHKAQGVTVDRAHMLATPGGHSHSTYVGLSRHRQHVDLYYGRDDFASRDKLVRALARDGSKDMASDYARADPARVFAERRGITFGERVVEAAKAVPEKARGMFDGLRLAIGRPEREAAAPERGRSMFADFRPPARKREAAPELSKATPHRIGIDRPVERYARAFADIERMHEKQLPVLPHQQAALDKAAAALDAMRPHARADLTAAFERQPGLVREVIEGNPAAGLRAMAKEAQVRLDPAVRADRFVEDWQRLRRGHDAATRSGARDHARAFSGQMGAMAKSLERDAQVESILRTRKAALGIDTHSARSVGQQLADIARLGRDRSRGIGIGM